ncbi:hypothetical protein V496_09147 [Pseudogymnoascus sp. VKM F-4515 (FW-2607)]|nr:hypothetical protein V496_09147 [Pseudogymnoascus sp. VKM F-4515 (FW-2607)]KFY70583.1 hypothetical protein V498_10311 [Pseudogymnoascus sp. VKM F-4517 (FW-2822)]
MWNICLEGKEGEREREDGREERGVWEQWSSGAERFGGSSSNSKDRRERATSGWTGATTTGGPRPYPRHGKTPQQPGSGTRRLGAGAVLLWAIGIS